MVALYFFILLVSVPFYWQDFFTGGAKTDYVQILNFLVWIFLNYALPKYAPVCTIITLFSHSLLWFIRFEEYQGEEDSRDIEVRVLQLIIFMTGINYNSYKLNVLLLSPAILIPYYLIVQKAA
jgi:hypothetical protein